MLRARSNGVAKFSQHTLGKAMDFFIPGASLEELRNTGLRLQRGGVGYYPTSGSPFVHLDVGNVRHWGPAISDTEMARIMSSHPVHVAAASNGAKRAAPSVSIKKSIPVASPGEDEEVVAAKPKPAPVRTAAPAKTNTFTVASLESRPVEASRPASAAAPAVAVPIERPAKAAATTTMSSDGARAAPPAAIDRTRLASLPPNPSPTGAVPAAKPSAPDTTASTVTWPVRGVDNDRVPTEMALAYGNPLAPGAATAMRQDPMAAKPTASHDNVTTVAKKTVVRTASLEPVAHRAEPASHAAAEPAATHVAALGGAAVTTGATVTTKVVVANAGMRYDDPWLRAMIMAPSLWDSMTATLYGTPDLSELRTLMRKPSSTLKLSFNDDPYSGMSPNRFRGEAVVFLTTHAFTQRTASLR
jgi:hypothetical protein